MDEAEGAGGQAAAIARLTAADVMSRPVVTVEVGDSLWTAVERFLVSGLRHLVVVEEGRCAGVLSDRHVVAEWPFDPLGLRLRRVGDVLEATFPAVPPGCPIVTAARAMVAHQVDALPVVDPAGAVLGVLTSSDFVRLAATLGAPERPTEETAAAAPEPSA